MTEKISTKKLAVESKPKEVEEMSFLDHLEELRWHLVRALLAVILCAIVVFIAKDFVFEHIIFAPKQEDFFTYRMFCALSELTCFGPPEFHLTAIQMGEQFFTHIKVSIFLGFTMAFPYVFWEMWRFVEPAMHVDEKKSSRGVVFITSLLFILGVLFGYYIITPFAIKFLLGYSVGVDAISNPSLASYVSYLTMFTMPAGLVFELPMVILLLSKVGLVTPELLRQYRRHAVILILILAAVITPPDVMSQFMIGIPVFILYEISIWISRSVQIKAEAKEKES